MTVLDLLTAALGELNYQDAGTPLSADDAQFALDRFNDWIDALQTEGLSIAPVSRTTWTLTPNVANYTIGIGATINVTRPVSPQAIEAIGYIDTTTGPPTQERLVPLLDVPAYADWPQKAATSEAPSAFYYNPTFAAGFGTISPLPIPTSGTLQGVIYLPSPVGEFTAVGNTLLVPPGYRRFYRTNLAVELAGAFQVQLPPGLEQRASEAKANVKRANLRIGDMGFGLGGTYDIWTDGYR